MKSLLQILNSKSKTLKSLSLSTADFDISGKIPGYNFTFFDRLRVFASSSVFIFCKTQLGTDRCPKYDPYIYERLPPNLVELHISFDGVLGLARHMHETFQDMIFGKCKCRSIDVGFNGSGVVSEKKCIEQIRQANFQQHWLNLVPDIHNNCESIAWLTSLVQQRNQGAFQSLKKIIAVEINDALRDSWVRSDLGQPSIDESGVFGYLEINQTGLCPWLEHDGLNVDLQASIFGKWKDYAKQILEAFTTGQSLLQSVICESSFVCSDCHQYRIPGRRSYYISGEEFYD